MVANLNPNRDLAMLLAIKKLAANLLGIAIPVPIDIEMTSSRAQNDKIGGKIAIAIPVPIAIGMTSSRAQNDKIEIVLTIGDLVFATMLDRVSAIVLNPKNAVMRVNSPIARSEMTGNPYLPNVNLASNAATIGMEAMGRATNGIISLRFLPTATARPKPLR
jgi:hypothetical protein